VGLPDIRYARNGEVSIAYSDEWRLFALAAGR
jgi:hypothetical protein